MSSSLFRAGRITHFKIVAISLVSAIVIVLIGVNARTSDNVTAQIRPASGVVKAGQPAIYSSQDDKAFR